jgi:SAM-dependent methyltransferase
MVGERGLVIGVDMTPEMVHLARDNARRVGATNVVFLLGEIEELPLADNSVDVVISNCVINLSPNKGAVFREAFRTLRPGGRLYVSDIVLNGELPEEIKADPQRWAACISGAELKERYLELIRRAGFTGVAVTDESPYRAGEPCLSVLASARVTARKPSQKSTEG